MKKTNTILDKILADKAEEVATLKRQRSLGELKASLSTRQTPIRDFRAAIAQPGKLGVIAEIKKASPSAGVIAPNFNHLEIANDYQESGLINAISILTERTHFQGELSFIKDIKSVNSLPLFRKDFIFDEYQIYESYLAEADALLLIVAALEPDELRHLIGVTQELGLSCLVETHSEVEIEQALAAGADIIGVNARDLKTFTIDKALFGRLSALIPAGTIKVAESGLETQAEILEVAHQGADAVLIGTSFMKARDRQATIKELLAFER